jgi:hypothetical protein
LAGKRRSPRHSFIYALSQGLVIQILRTDNNSRVMTGCGTVKLYEVEAVECQHDAALSRRKTQDFVVRDTLSGSSGLM